jgi:DNA-binding NarL/FixJ family response regulator
MTTVLVCDDAPLAREAVRRAVSTVPGVERVSSAGSGEEVLARYPLERPHVVLMDIRMPGMGGVEATRRLLAAHPSAVVVVLTLGEDVDGVAAAVAAGARGYLVKDATREEAAAVLGLAISPPSPRSGTVVPLPVRQHPSGPVLSEREIEVLEGMSRGKSNAQIGRELYLSEDTVKTHARRLFRKMGASDRAQAVALGFRWGLLS